MLFTTMGNKANPAILFFHAMGVTGDSSRPVAEFLQQHYYCILPTSTVYCGEQHYRSKTDEVWQVTQFLQQQGVTRLALVVASSLGADLAMEFLTHAPCPVAHVFFDGGQFAQIPRPVRCIMTPFLYLAIKSLYWSGGKTLKYILWCADASIRPYFVAAGKGLRYGNLRRQLKDSLENKPFPPLSDAMQRRMIFAFGSVEEHFQYRAGVIHTYPYSVFPVFVGYNHMQYQIRDPEGFAAMLVSVMEHGELPPLPFCELTMK